MSRATLPTLTSLSSVNADGSKKQIHPADVHGPFTLWRRVAGLILLGIYIALPWIPVNGYPAVFLDVAERRFHFFGLTLATQDLWVGFFLVTGLAFSLFYVTALFGRIWCGWTCPYTVFLEHVYRRVERWIEGDAPARRALDAAPRAAGKIAKRILKHAAFLLISLFIAHVFLSYFVSLKGLYGMMQGPPRDHLLAFGVVCFLTLALHFAFGWFREQFCVILCPYGRLQSALTDDNSVVIGYDRKRGEPRGKPNDPGVGDCVACNRCVQVCPTGIDIRNGLQLECIGCAACVDACDDVMSRLGRRKGLVRYDSLSGLLGGKTRFIRPRTILYTILLAAGVAAFSIAAAGIKPLRVNAVRMIGAPYFLSDGKVRNQFLLRVINKRNAPATYRIEVEGERPAGLTITGEAEPLTLPALGEDQRALVFSLPEAEFHGPSLYKIRVIENGTGHSEVTRQLEMLGPDQTKAENEVIDPRKYLQ